MKDADYDQTDSNYDLSDASKNQEDGKVDVLDEGSKVPDALELEYREKGISPESSVTVQEKVYPEVSGFEKCEQLREQGIKESLDTLPESHRQRIVENLSRIEYVDNEPEDSAGRRVYGEVNLEGEGGTRLTLYRHDDSVDPRMTLHHEYGHLQYNDLSPEQQEGWYRLYISGGEEGEVEPHIMKAYTEEQRPEEDFCESYAYYRVSPEELARTNPYKYKFMKYQVYEGRGYMNQVDESRLLYGRNRV